MSGHQHGPPSMEPKVRLDLNSDFPSRSCAVLLLFCVCSCLQNERLIIRLGIDIGSTTCKAIAVHSSSSSLPPFRYYARHHSNIVESIQEMIHSIDLADDTLVRISISGSGGIGLAPHLGIPHIQEVVALATVIHRHYPAIDVAIEIGGEDGKLFSWLSCFLKFLFPFGLKLLLPFWVLYPLFLLFPPPFLPILHFLTVSLSLASLFACLYFSSSQAKLFIFVPTSIA